MQEEWVSYAVFCSLGVVLLYMAVSAMVALLRPPPSFFQNSTRHVESRTMRTMSDRGKK